MDKYNLETLYIPYDFDDQREVRVRIYLPQHYESSELRYPVLYMLDGQNVFYDEESYSDMSWRAVEALKLTSLDDRFIIVAIDNGADKRFLDYVPYQVDFPLEIDDVVYTTGYGREYADFIANTVKPVIDETYPTKSNRKYNAITGSSLGGLMTAYFAAEYNHVFKYFGVFSLASSFCKTDFLNHVTQAKANKKTKIYINSGTQEGLDEKGKGSKPVSQTFINSVLEYLSALIKSGISIDNIDVNLTAFEIHREAFWARQLPNFLNFIKNDMNLSD